MFGIVLKNSILMFLIILITHFFLDNSKKKLMDRYTRNTLNLIEDEATKKVVSTTPKVKNEEHAPMNEKDHVDDEYDTSLTLNIDNKEKNCIILYLMTMRLHNN